MASAKSSKLIRRINGILGLFIGIFGALAILGVFFKIAKYPNYELFMTVGFIGEAGAFIIMGVLTLITSFMSSKEDERAAAGSGLSISPDAGAAFEAALQETAAEFRSTLQSASQSYRSSMDAAATEFRDSMQGMLRDQLSADLEAASEVVQGDVRSFGMEIRGLGEEMGRARNAVKSMSAEMESVATGTLADDAELLGSGMRQLSQGMSEAGSTVDRMRADLNEMASRFHAFNGHGRPSENGFGVPVAGRKEASRKDKAGVA